MPHASPLRRAHSLDGSTPIPAPGPVPPASVRVLVADVPDLDEMVADGARRAAELGRAVELVEPPVPEGDHAAMARSNRQMDHAVQVARAAAPGTPVRIARPLAIPHARSPYASRRPDRTRETA